MPGIKLDIPCPKCGGMNYREYSSPKRKHQRVCLDCQKQRDESPKGAAATKNGKLPANVAAAKQAKVAAMLGMGNDAKQVAAQTGLTVSHVQRIKATIKGGNGPDELLNDSYRKAQHVAAAEVIPVAKRVALLGLREAEKAMIHGVERVVGKDKATGQPIMAVEKPNLMHMSSMVREAAFLTGVGRGSILENEQDRANRIAASQAEESSKPTINIKLDPRVLAAALRALDDVDNAPPRIIDVTPKVERE